MLLEDIRDPSMDEVAEWINRDSEEELFRKIFYKVKENKDLTEPAQHDVEYGKTDLTSKIVRCLLWKEGVLKEAKSPDFDNTNLKDYYNSNKDILENIETEVNRDSSKVTSVQFEFPKKLRIFTGRRYYTRKYD